jgi:predicted Zn-dependent peptidase
MKRPGLLIGLLGLLVLAGTAADIQLPVKTLNLDNGLQVILLPSHETPIIYSLVRYKVGSANETTGITGISHVLEHMMFKGTKEFQTLNYDMEVPIMEKQDEYFAEVRRLRQLKVLGRAPANADKQIETLLLKIKGLNVTQKILTIQNDVDVATFQVGFGRLSADTSFDRTHYFELFPANCLEAWAYFESSRMRDPVFREFHSERDVVLEERRQTNETQPEALLQELFLSTAFMAHPYHWDVIGWRSDLENLTRNDIHEYHRLYYAPNNAIVVLVGDFDPVAAQELVQKYFGRIPSQPISKPVPLTLEPPQRGERRASLRYSATPRLMVGYHRCAANHPDFPVFELMDALLARGRGSMLYKELIKSGLAVDFTTGIGEMKRFPGLFSISATAAEGVPLQKLEATILAEVERLKQQPVSQRTLDEAKSLLTGRLLRQLQDGESLAVVLAEGLDFSGSPMAFNRYLGRLQAVNPEDIQRVAREWLTQENRTVAWLEPPVPERSVQ